MERIRPTFDINYVSFFLILGSGCDYADSGHLCEPYRKRFLCGQLSTTQRQVRSFKETVSADLHTFIRDEKKQRKVIFVLLLKDGKSDLCPLIIDLKIPPSKFRTLY
jgi:hypothetical protein